MDATYIPKDINKFPRGYGFIFLPISMSRIDNAQSAKECVQFLDYFKEKIQEPKVGIHFLYTEALYMSFEDKAYETKNAFDQKMVNHMHGVKKLIEKDFMTFQIRDAFHFESWFQTYLSHNDFLSFLNQVKDEHHKDELFQKYIKEDIEDNNREYNEKQIDFFLEEHAMTYLILNRQLSLDNKFVQGREEWLILSYPGKPLKAQVYLYQKDMLNLNKDSNPYKGLYNMTERVFYDFSKMNVEEM